MLQHAPLAALADAAGVNLVCAGAALALERRLPENVRRTPHDAAPAPLASTAG